VLHAQLAKLDAVAVGAGAAAGGVVAHLDHLAVRLEVSVKERRELGGAHARENRRALVDGVEPPHPPGLGVPRQLALRRRLGAVVHGSAVLVDELQHDVDGRDALAILVRCPPPPRERRLCKKKVAVILLVLA